MAGEQSQAGPPAGRSSKAIGGSPRPRIDQLPITIKPPENRDIRLKWQALKIAGVGLNVHRSDRPGRESAFRRFTLVQKSTFSINANQFPAFSPDQSFNLRH